MKQRDRKRAEMLCKRLKQIYGTAPRQQYRNNVIAFPAAQGPRLVAVDGERTPQETPGIEGLLRQLFIEIAADDDLSVS